MPRTAHYVVSTHWDREWYEPLQGYRMRLVSLLDEVFETLERDPSFKTFVMDGQYIPVADYLEVRPEKAEMIRRYVKEGRFKVGPWYVLPDEWLVSGESIIRNIQLGMRLSDELGAPSSRAGFACDLFGHISQLPQLFQQLGIPFAYIWRGTYEKEHHGHLNWKSPDGTSIPSYRFGRVGYCTFAFDVRECQKPDEKFDPEAAVQKVVDFTLIEAARSPLGPILLFDGGDHIEIEPAISGVLAKANEKLAAHDIRIVHSDFDRYQSDVLKEVKKIDKQLVGELRETGREQGKQDEQWLIPGVYSSRIHLKQRNVRCEDELSLFAEPFSALATQAIQREYPLGYLRLAWKHLLDNHPHDSICGCSPDQVHQDMIYRFDQSIGISARLTRDAMRAITVAVSAKSAVEGSLKLCVFNHTAESIDQPIDLDIPLPADWAKKFQEFFGFEEKFAFKLRDSHGDEIPYQLVSQQRSRLTFRRPRKKFPQGDTRHVIGVTAQLKVPAFGYTTLFVEPSDPPTRYVGTMATSHRTIENEHLTVQANNNGTIDITLKKSGKTFSQLLTFEQRADIGDGWYHGVAVNDQIITSTASAADVALIADGMNKATLRIALTMNVPEAFDFKAMMRSDRLAPLKIVSDITLRRGSHSVEVTTTVQNNVLDHRLRVLMPTNLHGDTFFSDSAFDVVERKIGVAADNAMRKELDVETKPHQSWSAFSDGKHGLAVIARGLPEIAVIDTLERPLALTLLRAFRRAVLSNDNMGGQIQGTHVFRYDLRPFAGELPIKQLFLAGQRLHGVVRQIDLLPADVKLNGEPSHPLPAEASMLNVDGEVVVTSVQRQGDDLLVRLFNPNVKAAKVTLSRGEKFASVRCLTLDGRDDAAAAPKLAEGAVSTSVPPKRIMTFALR
jgi:alpha-mannosidase/mannosylglycerate hydrolase